MKRSKFWLLVAVLVLVAVIWSVAAPLSGWTFATSSTTDQTGCPTSTNNVFCGVTTATGAAQAWMSLNGGAFVMIYPQTSSGAVISVNSKTGAVVLNYSDLAAPPTQLTMKCPTASIGSGGLDTGATVCTISVLK